MTALSPPLTDSAAPLTDSAPPLNNAGSPPLSGYLQRADRADRRVYPRPWDSRYAAATLVRRGLERAAAKHFSPGSVLLDFGCGNMPYRPMLSKYLARYEGIDLAGNSEATHHLLADGVTSVPEGYGDIVLSTQVLEHVISPVAYLAEARRMLKPGGLLALSTHGLWLHHPDPVDYHRWTGPGLKRLVEEAGFETVDFIGMMGLLPAGLQLASDGLIRRVVPKGLRKYVGPAFALATQSPMLWMDRLHSEAQRSFDAAAYLIVARKAG